MSVRNPFAMWGGAVCIIFSSSLDCRLTSSPYIPCRNTGGEMYQLSSLLRFYLRHPVILWKTAGREVLIRKL